MKRKIGKAVQYAQIKMQDACLKAAREFTEETGMIAVAVSWDVATAIDATRKICAVEYYMPTSDIKAGVS